MINFDKEAKEATCESMREQELDRRLAEVAKKHLRTCWWVTGVVLVLVLLIVFWLVAYPSPSLKSEVPYDKALCGAFVLLVLSAIYNGLAVNRNEHLDAQAEGGMEEYEVDEGSIAFLAAYLKTQYERFEKAASSLASSQSLDEADRGWVRLIKSLKLEIDGFPGESSLRDQAVQSLEKLQEEAVAAHKAKTEIINWYAAKQMAIKARYDSVVGEIYYLKHHLETITKARQLLSGTLEARGQEDQANNQLRLIVEQRAEQLVDEISGVMWVVPNPEVLDSWDAPWLVRCAERIAALKAEAESLVTEAGNDA